jgi:hypothetical protein
MTTLGDCCLCGRRIDLHNCEGILDDNSNFICDACGQIDRYQNKHIKYIGLSEWFVREFEYTKLSREDYAEIKHLIPEEKDLYESH